MHRPALIIIIILLAAQICAAQDAVLSQCPTLKNIVESGQLEQIKSPYFENVAEARQFAAECRKVVSELDSAAPLSPDYARLREQAALTAEFLTGDTYLLSTSKIKSVVKLREWVKIPPPPGFVYVKKYSSQQAMPPEVSRIFDSLKGGEGTNVRGVTIQGRFIALIVGDYHDELEDNLAHEMVHAYITIASPKPLPKWFQESTAVYFSTGKESKIYGKTGDPTVVQMTLPADYKQKLYSLKYIESKIGRKKLFKFVKESVETGNVDGRKVLGLSSNAPQNGATPPYAILIGGGAIILVVIGWFIAHRDRDD
ncbi:MAG: hypothetical protein ABFD64_10950 [Armatimonadota bacterium]